MLYPMVQFLIIANIVYDIRAVIISCVFFFHLSLKHIAPYTLHNCSNECIGNKKNPVLDQQLNKACMNPGATTLSAEYETYSFNV